MFLSVLCDDGHFSLAITVSGHLQNDTEQFSVSPGMSGGAQGCGYFLLFNNHLIPQKDVSVSP